MGYWVLDTNEHSEHIYFGTLQNRIYLFHGLKLFLDVFTGFIFAGGSISGCILDNLCRKLVCVMWVFFFFFFQYNDISQVISKLSLLSIVELDCNLSLITSESSLHFKIT